jgi:hypothetical protein
LSQNFHGSTRIELLTFSQFVKTLHEVSKWPMMPKHVKHLHRDDRDDHVNWWHLIAHGIAFCAGVGIAAIILLPYYPQIQDRTDTAGDAFGAFLTLCVIFGGLGPLITLAFFSVQRLVRRRSIPRKRQRTP